MKIMKLRMKSFGPYLDEQIIDFTELKNNRMFLIHGQTGSGKTSLLDGITYALYGDASGSLREKRDLRSHFAGDDNVTEVELIFSVRNEVYKIIRKPDQEIIGKRGKVIKKDSEVTLFNIKGECEEFISDKADQTRDEIEKIIGFNADQFRQVIILPQGEFRKLLESSSQDKERILTKIFRTEKYSRLQDFIHRKNEGMKNEINSLDSRMSAILSESESVNIDDAGAKLVSLKTNIGQLESASSDLLEKIYKENRNFEKIKSNNKKIDDLCNAQIKYDNLVKQIESINADKNLLALARKALPLSVKESGLEKTLATSESRKNELARIKEDHEKAILEYERAEKDYEAISSMKDEIASDEKKLDRLKNTLQKLESYFVMKKKFIDHKDVLKILQEQNEKLKSELQKIKKDKSLYADQIASGSDSEFLIKHLSESENKLKEYSEARKIFKNNSELSVEMKNYEKSYDADRIELEKLSSKKNKIQDEYEVLKGLFIKGQASLLAENLEENKPCPVCGSLDHPHKAVRGKDIPDKSILDMKEKEIQIVEEDIIKTENKINQLNVKLASIKTTIEKNNELTSGYINEEDRDKIDLLIADTGSTINEINGKLEKLKLLKMKINDAEKNEEDTSRQQNESEKKYNDAHSIYIELKTNLENMAREIPENDRDEKELTERINLLEEKISRFHKEFDVRTNERDIKKTNRQVAFDRLTNANNETEKAKAAAVKETEEFKISMRAGGFVSIEEYRKYKLSEDEIQKIEKRINLFNDELQSAKALYDKLSEDVSGLEHEKEDGVNETINTMKDEYEKINNLVKEKSSKMNIMVKSIEEYKKLFDEYRNKIKKAEVIGGLSEVIKGKTPLKTYVLMSFLDEVLEVANKRLSKMSNTRYSFVRSRLITGSGYKGLEIDIFDEETGKERPVSTLSGGEGFVASLSLALGLADVVQSYSGGIEMDTIFIDEGFGSLDAQSLEHAIKTLMEINQKGRLVGIISHVDELKRLFEDCRLEVTRNSKGSTAKFVIA